MTGIYRLRLSIEGRRSSYFFVEPCSKNKLFAEEKYEETKSRLIKRGVATKQESISLMIDAGVWSKEKEEYLKNVEKDIQNIKKSLYERRNDSIAVKTIRERLRLAKEIFIEKSRERNFIFVNSVENMADSVRLSCIVGMGLQKPLGKRVWKGQSFWKDSQKLLEEASIAYYAMKPTPEQIRSAARSDYWRTIWCSKEACGSIFGKPSIDLSEDQKSLLSWSRVYDNAREDSEPPEDFVFEDDDMFDGWMQKRFDEKSSTKNELTGFINEKIANMDHVFITGQAVAMSDGASVEEALDRGHTPETIERVYNIGGAGNAQRAMSKLAKADKAGEAGYKEKGKK